MNAYPGNHWIEWSAQATATSSTVPGVNAAGYQATAAAAGQHLQMAHTHMLYNHWQPSPLTNVWQPVTFPYPVDQLGSLPLTSAQLDGIQPHAWSLMSPVATGSSTQPGPTSQPHSASPLATLENEARDSTQRQQSPAQNASTPEQLSLDIAFYDLQARQPDSHEPIFVAERSEVHHLDAPFPCAIDGCMTYIAPKNQDIKDHLAYAHSIRDPVRCPWPDHLCKDKHDLKDARTVCRHIRERHGWKFTWRCPWCRKDYPPGMRRDSARRLNKDCFDKEQAKRQVQLVIAEVTKLIEERPELAEDLLASCPSVFEGLNAPQE